MDVFVLVTLVQSSETGVLLAWDMFLFFYATYDLMMFGTCITNLASEARSISLKTQSKPYAGQDNFKSEKII